MRPKTAQIVLINYNGDPQILQLINSPHEVSDCSLTPEHLLYENIIFKILL